MCAWCCEQRYLREILRRNINMKILDLEELVAGCGGRDEEGTSLSLLSGACCCQGKQQGE